MAFTLQRFRDLLGNPYAVIGVCVAVSVTAYFTLSSHHPNYPRKKRRMSSFPNLTNNITIMAKYLTPDLFSKLKDRGTTKNYDIEQLIESGLGSVRPSSLAGNPAGLLAGDEECYDVFNELMDPVIRELHEVDLKFRSDINLNWEQIKGGKLYGSNVLCCRLSGRRNIEGYRMVPASRATELLDVSHPIVTTLESIWENIGDSFLSVSWQNSNSAMEEYGSSFVSLPPQLSRDWPHGRFVWLAENRQCQIFINFEDHLKVVITQTGGDIQRAFRRYSEILSSIEEGLKRNEKKFMWSSKYGYLTSSPHNIGTGLEVEVEVRLSKLCKDPRFERIIHVLPVKLDEADPQAQDVFCIRNKYKMQLTEVDILQQVINSVTLLVEIDKRINRGENIRDLLP
ncbi:creatine kinase M-type-like [Pocillopora verrucosa]|uniref:creatine kinase M-type-like n=1 Tax=Pocillopora verrucosa TaxID=203993 RepID=UPI00333FC803